MERLIENRTYNSPYKALAIILLGLFFVLPAFGQQKTKIKIKRADKQEYRKQGEEDLFWLVGNVVYEHKGAIMHCDSSIYYRAQNRFEAFGNVLIEQGDSIKMTGERLDYDGNTGMLNIRDSVRLQDGSMNLKCDGIIYNRNTNVAAYTTGGTVTQDLTSLVSKKGFYSAASKLFSFKDSVHLTHPDYDIVTDTLQYGSENKVAYFHGPTTIVSDSAKVYCEDGKYDTQNDIAILTQNAEIVKGAQTIRGDSIYYELKEGMGDITGNAYISDTINKYVITGQEAIYKEEPEYAMVTDRPLYALRIEEDTLLITGDTIRVVGDSLKRRIVRVGRNTRFYKSDFQGTCDSLNYFEADSTFHLYHNPVLWNAENQLTADFIFMTTKRGRLDSLYMLNNAFLIEREDSVRFNQIKGRNMYGKFIENELRTIFVSGNGQTVYYAYDDEDKEIGVNRADCSDLRITIVESRVKRVTFLKKPNATLYPPGRIPKGELFLKGFRARFDEQIHSREELFKE